jgi:hypothetical protein
MTRALARLQVDVSLHVLLPLLIVLPLLASCGDDMRLHTSSEADLKRSHERIMQRLPPGEATVFDAALRDIVVQRMGARRSPQTTSLAAELDAFPAAAATGSALRSYAFELAREIETGWDRLRISALRENAAALLDRRTVPEILEIARQERERDAERSRAAATRLAARAQTRLEDVERRLSSLASTPQEDAATLSGVAVSGETLILRNVAGVEEPILTFTLRNESDMRPGRIHFLVTVSRDGLDPVARRAVIAYDIPGGLQPGAVQRHVIAMTRLLDETLGRNANLFQVAIDLAPVAMEDARGRRAGLRDVDELAIDRLGALRDLVARIEAHAEDVAASLRPPSASGEADPGDPAAVEAAVDTGG